MTRHSRHYRLDMPADLSDEAAAEILDFLYEIVRAFESRHFAQISRHHDALRAEMMDAADAQSRPAADPASPNTDPPF